MYGKEYYKRPQYSADMIHQEAMKWLDKQDGKQPFFGIFTYTLPHAELVQPEDSILEGYQKKFFHDKTWGGSEGSRYNASVHTHAQFAGMITRLDHYVGEVLKKLKEKGMDENTLHYLLADLARRLGKNEDALRLLSIVITSRSASSRMKDEALKLKDMIRESIKNNK